MRFADPKPPFCSACFQHSTGPHVDFEAFWDGPVIERDGVKVPVDDLILCESCVRAAGNLLGLSDQASALTKHKQQQDEIDRLNDELKVKDSVISDLTYTNTALAEYPVKRRPGKPHFVGVPDDVKDELLERRKRSEAQKKVKT